MGTAVWYYFFDTGSLDEYCESASNECVPSEFYNSFILSQFSNIICPIIHEKCHAETL